MRKVRVGLAAPLLFGAVAIMFQALPVVAQDNATPGPIVYHQLQHDVSLPLWMIARAPHGGAEEGRIIIPENTGPRGIETNVKDPVGDDAEAAGRPEVGTTSLLNFDGISHTNSFCGCAPPDTEGVVGATQYVQYVNTAYEVYNKTTGASVLGPLAGNSFWSGFGGQCQNNDDGDPIVAYDKVAQRWFFGQNVFVTPYTVCIAVSTTSDATGSYNRYSYSLGNSSFPDYPKWGVWPDPTNNAYFQSFNIFAGGFTETGSEACAADRAAMLAGSAAPNFVCFVTPLSNRFNILPADLDGTTLPPSGSPGYYLELASATGNLNIWQFKPNFTTPSSSTFTGPTLITTAAFNEVCPSTLRNACIKQPSPGELLEGLSDRLMYRLNYRNFGTYESLLVTHSVVPTGSGVTALSAARWYEVRSPGSSPTVFQQGTFQNNKISYWMGSIAQDQDGNMALGYSGTDTSLDPSVFYTGRLSTDPLNTMESPKLVVKGTGVQESTSNRWGDYSLMSVDPTDDCTFWYTQMYIKTTGSFNWNTRINSFKFPSCS
ncbi:MAG TPA: hypothetical protein VG206_24895 [Terriglobia bacterium]|nr:hypothetical protein [Terriglobia bacterium]